MKILIYRIQWKIVCLFEFLVDYLKIIKLPLHTLNLYGMSIS